MTENKKSNSNNSNFLPIQLGTTVGTNVKSEVINDNNSNDQSNYEFFGLAEVGVQTDFTKADIDDLINSKLASLGQKDMSDNLQNENKVIEIKGNSNNTYLKHKRGNEENDNKKKDIGNNSNQNKKGSKDNINNEEKKNNDKNDSREGINFDSLKLNMKKIDAFYIFKREFKQANNIDNEEELEKECKKEWNNLAKDLKKCYNLEAINENKRYKDAQKLNKISKSSPKNNNKAK